MAHIEKGSNKLVYRDVNGIVKRMDMSLMTEGFGEFLGDLMEKVDYLIVKSRRSPGRKR